MSLRKIIAQPGPEFHFYLQDHIAPTMTGSEMKEIKDSQSWILDQLETQKHSVVCDEGRTTIAQPIRLNCQEEAQLESMRTRARKMPTEVFENEIKNFEKSGGKDTLFLLNETLGNEFFIILSSYLGELRTRNPERFRDWLMHGGAASMYYVLSTGTRQVTLLPGNEAQDSSGAFFANPKKFDKDAAQFLEAQAKQLGLSGPVAVVFGAEHRLEDHLSHCKIFCPKDMKDIYWPRISAKANSKKATSLWPRRILEMLSGG